jgi:hypothetical protein
MATGFQSTAFQPSAFQGGAGSGGGGSGTGCGFQASAFQNSAFQNCGGAQPAVRSRAAGAPSGERKRRKKYVLGEREVSLTREELEDALEAMLQQSEPVTESVTPPKVAMKDRQIVAVSPNYPAIRDMLVAAKQIEAAQALRQIALRLADEQDEQDVEALLLWG